MKAFLRIICCFIGCLIGIPHCYAQDVHFSQYNASPLMLNPALAGLSAGDYRAYANFRLQWPTISNGYTYRTVAAGYDMAIGKVTKFNSYAGIGVSFYSDEAGDLNFSTDRVDVTFAYHFMLNAKATQQISAGLQGALNYSGINPNNSTQDSQWDEYTGLLTGPKETFGRTSVFYGDAGLGALYSGTFKNDLNFYSGIALNHVNQPKISFFPGEDYNSFSADERLYMKLTIHGGLSIPIGARLSLLPNYVVYVQGPSYQFIVGSNIKMALGSNAKASISSIQLGAAYRGSFDAVIYYFRYAYKGFSLGLSYDMNVSKLVAATETVGAPELSIIYEGLYRKKPKPGHCPVLY